MDTEENSKREEKEKTVQRIEEPLILDLPDDIFINLFSKLSAKEAFIVSSSSRYLLGKFKLCPILNLIFRCQTTNDEYVERTINKFDISVSTLPYHFTNKPLILDIYWPTLKKKEHKEYITRWLSLAKDPCIKELSIDVCPNIKDKFLRNICYDWPEIKLLGKSLQIMSIKGCHIPSTRYLFKENHVSLRILSLKKVLFGSITLNELLSCCPSLKEFTYEGLCSSDVFKISKVEELRKVYVYGVMNVEIEDAPNLGYVESDCDFRRIVLKGCNSIKNLSLIQINLDNVSELNMHPLLSQLPNLRTLIVKFGDFINLQISSGSCLKIFSSEIVPVSLEKITFIYSGQGKPSYLEFDTTNLRRYVYIGSRLPKRLSVMFPESIEGRIFLKPSNDVTSWLAEFRTFIRNHEGRMTLSLKIESCNRLLPLLEFSERRLPQACNVDSLELQADSSSPLDNIAVIEELFSCCQPNTLLVKPTNKFLKALQEILVGKDEHCRNNPKCWHRHFRYVEVKTVHGAKEFKSLKDDDLHKLLGEGTLQFHFMWMVNVDASVVG